MNLPEAIAREFEAVKPEMDRAAGMSTRIFSHEDNKFVVYGFTDEGADGGQYYVASFKMRSSLQCGAIAVPYHVEVAEEQRGRGIGKILERVRIRAARAAGFAIMLATTRADNQVQIHVMHEAGWQHMRQFYNPGTGHDVILWMLPLEAVRCCECGGQHECEDCSTFTGAPT